MRRSAILVSVAIVSMCLTKNTAVAAGAVLRVCGPDQRVFVPLQYAYWLSAAPPMMVMESSVARALLDVATPTYAGSRAR